jgi:FkbM family methyltransferase
MCRLVREYASRQNEFVEVMLPWRLPIRVRPSEVIGRAIWGQGVHELCVSECLWRLLDRGETAVDVGANIGYMTSLMAVRVGAGGWVVAVEPHPEVLEELEYNAERWQRTQVGKIGKIGKIRLIGKALSNECGPARLVASSVFEQNRGTATLEVEVGRGSSQGAWTVERTTLDTLAESVLARVHLLKLDVEGHELAVLEGAERLLRRGGVRDIIFEEHAMPPTAVTEMLSEYGYSIFYLDKRLLGPKAVPISEKFARRSGEAPSYLATLDPERAQACLSARGWSVLRRPGP